MFENAKRWARKIKQNLVALYLASRDPRTPWAAKVVAVLVVAYALSPIDLIPDFIPVIGYLDDLLIVPLGMLLAIRLIPAALFAEFQQRASAHDDRPPANRTAAIVVLVIWCLVAALAIWWLSSRLDFA
ncbi:MAG: DUF1232 domain-containing protein [Alphaproteobacteria bacterium]|nr:DUF1232 domain-containing protein [Alphaproteobacteria bacterium]